MKTSLTLRSIVFYSAALLFAGCSSPEAIPVKQPVSYLALGDSYTIGEGVEESMRWPNQLRDELQSLNFEVSKTNIIARTGWTTGELLNAIADSSFNGYNLVSLLIGVNNQYRGQSFGVFQTEFDSLLGICIEAAGKSRVFVLSIPDYGVTPFGSGNREQIAQEIDMYNAYIRQRCEDQCIPFVDVTGISRQLGDSPGSLAGDNLHPSSGQYTKWVEAALPEVVELIMK